MLGLGSGLYGWRAGSAFLEVYRHLCSAIHKRPPPHHHPSQDGITEVWVIVQAVSGKIICLYHVAGRRRPHCLLVA